MSSFNDLISRVEGGETSAELEAEVCAALHVLQTGVDANGNWTARPAPILRSIDAALAHPPQPLLLLLCFGLGRGRWR